MMEDLTRLAEDEVLMKELLDDLSPLFMQPYYDQSLGSNSADSHLPFHGPTFDDVETAAAFSYVNHGAHMSEADRIYMLERSYSSKASNESNYKYTLRMKNSGSVLADDGYKWRKYGQKSIKNSPNPRSYYRCRNSRCSAKKQVERSIEDPETVIISYEGLHLHYTYPFLMLNNQPAAPPLKKQKPSPSNAQTVNGSEEDLMGQEGLLEDVVPLMIRQPAAAFSHSNPTTPFLGLLPSQI